MSEKSNVLTKPGSFFKSIGPSILFVALSLNGGEMLLWPNLVSNYSLSLLWFVPLILTLQWATNVEIWKICIERTCE
jgi:Na+/pantothenate symporter